MQLKTLKLTAILLLAISTRGPNLLIAADVASSQPANTELLEPKPVTDSKTGVSCQPPKGWANINAKGNTAFQAPDKDVDEGGSVPPNFNIGIAKAADLKVADLKAMLESTKKKYAEIFDAFKVINEQKVEVNGKTSIILDYTFTTQKTIKVQQRQVWIATDGAYYIITFTSLASTFEKHQPAIEATTKTITVP